MPAPAPPPKISTGLAELDLILLGGLPEGRLYLLEGTPGTGKTTFGLTFAIDGLRRGERALYVTLSETLSELHGTAASHGWSLDGIDLFDLTPLEGRLEAPQTVLFPADVELGETVQRILDRVRQTTPHRLVIDSLAELRLLAHERLRFRRQFLALKAQLAESGCTTVVLDDLTSESSVRELHSLVHGVISLERWERPYGTSRRRLRIAKMRGSDFQSGWHDFAVQTGGLCVYPSLVGDDRKASFTPELAPTDLPELDEMLGGGLSRGTITLVVGPSGAGKSSLAMQCAAAAARRDECTAYFGFDEGLVTLTARSSGLGLGVTEAIHAGKLNWHRGMPSRLAPGEFAWQVRQSVERQGARVVVIDSLNSYLGTMPQEQALILQIHELLIYLSNQGVVTILVMAQNGLLGDIESPLDLSFLSDTIVLLRFFEAEGAVRKAISVVKKRTGRHEDAIREYRLSDTGLQVGPQLLAFHGVLTGLPAYAGPAERLLAKGGDEPA